MSASKKKLIELRFPSSEHVAEIVFCNPKKLNVLGVEFFNQLDEALDAIESNKAIRCAILRADGRMFTAGLDLKVAAKKFFSIRNEKKVDKKTSLILYLVKKWQQSITRLETSRVPIIAAVHNKCIGGGVDIITACDFRVCTEDASFCVLETKLAIVADIGTTQRITNVVGKGMAREMVYTGNYISSERASQCGLVNTVYTDVSAMLKGVRKTALQIAANSPLTVQGCKKVLNYSDSHSLQDGLNYVAMWNAGYVMAEDGQIAMKAFMTKTKPIYSSSL